MVRCSPEDGTNGFFVACFIRASGERPKRKAVEDEGHEEEITQSADIPDQKDTVVSKKRQRKRPLADGSDEEWGGISY